MAHLNYCSDLLRMVFTGDKDNQETSLDREAEEFLRSLEGEGLV